MAPDFQVLFWLLLLAPLVCSFTLETSRLQYMGRTFRTWGVANAGEKTPPDAKIWTYSRADSAWQPVADLSSVLQEQGVVTKRGGKKESAVGGRVSLVSPAHVSGTSFGSLARFSDASLWAVGPSGSVFERFWNGYQWVFIPHDLPEGAGKASALVTVNRTVLATSEKGFLYHAYMNSQQELTWRFCGPKDPTKSSNSLQGIKEESERGNTSTAHRIKGPGVPTGEGGTVFFATRGLQLTELMTLWPQTNWGYHGAPKDADVQAVADAGQMRKGFVLIISSSGDLYELELGPSHVWRKHSRVGSDLEDVELLPGSGVVLKGMHGVSIFLPTIDGRLAERRLSHGAWMWIVHPHPPKTRLSVSGRGPLALPYQALMAQGGAPPTTSAKVADNLDSVLFATAEDGSLWEYEPSFSQPKAKNTKTRSSNFRTTKKQDAVSNGGNSEQGVWTPHGRPGIPIQTGVTGIELSKKRLVFMLEDGRLVERFLSGAQVNEGWPSDAFWIMVEVPETEGGNAEYCSNARGPTNCVDGATGRLVKTPPQQTKGVSRSRDRERATERTDMITESDDEVDDDWDDDELEEEESSLSADTLANENESSDRDALSCKQESLERCEISAPSSAPRGVHSSTADRPPKREWEQTFRLRSVPASGTILVMHQDGQIAEKRWKNGDWSWRVEDNMGMRPAALVASINGSLIAVDHESRVWLRERTLGGIHWDEISPPEGIGLAGGFPLDWPPQSESQEKAGPVYFIGDQGKLIELELDGRDPNWHDIGRPSAAVSIAAIADVGTLRKRGAFCIGTDGTIYYFNLVSRKWSFFGQPTHVRLAPQSGAAVHVPGTSRGSLFMLSVTGALVEIFWGGKAWAWSEHFQPPGRKLSALGPVAIRSGGWFSVLAVGTNGEVYERRNSEEGWVWVKHGYPNVANLPAEFGWLTSFQKRGSSLFKSASMGSLQANSLEAPLCNPKVEAVRPLLLAQTSAVFLLKDGRMAELHLDRDTWTWKAVVATPFTTCPDAYRERK